MQYKRIAALLALLLALCPLPAGATQGSEAAEPNALERARLFPGDGSFMLDDLYPLSDGEVLCFGVLYQDDRRTGNPVAYRLDAQDNVLWRWTPDALSTQASSRALGWLPDGRMLVYTNWYQTFALNEEETGNKERLYALSMDGAVEVLWTDADFGDIDWWYAQVASDGALVQTYYPVDNEVEDIVDAYVPSLTVHNADLSLRMRNRYPELRWRDLGWVSPVEDGYFVHSTHYRQGDGGEGGPYGHSYALAMRLDADGEVAWENTLRGAWKADFIGGCATGDGGLLAGGFTTRRNIAAEKPEGYLVRFNPYGEVLYERYFADWGIATLEEVALVDGLVFVTGRAWEHSLGHLALLYNSGDAKPYRVMALDLQGTPLASLLFEVDGDATLSRLSIRTDPEGKPYVCGSIRYEDPDGLRYEVVPEDAALAFMLPLSAAELLANPLR